MILVAAALDAAHGIFPRRYGGCSRLGAENKTSTCIETKPKRHQSFCRLVPCRTGLFRRTFSLCDASCLEDESARISFAGDGVVSLPIQENDPACEGTVCNIKAVCDIMTDVQRGSEASFLPSNMLSSGGDETEAAFDS